MSDEEEQEYEADQDDHLETDVVLPDGDIKENFRILLSNSVREEKERIWASENQRGPPGLHELVLVILGPDGRQQKVMNDEAKIEDYLDDITHGTIKFVRRQ